MPKFDINLFIAHLSIDCVVFGYEKGEIKVLLSKPTYVKGFWSLPGGYILKTEGIEQAASRILTERTQLKNIYLEQFKVFGSRERNIENEQKELIKAGLKDLDADIFDEEVVSWMTERFISIGFYALVDIKKVKPQTGFLEDSLVWYSLKEIPELTYDHSFILNQALEALKRDLDIKLIGFNLLPEKFTMKEVQHLYEAVYEKSFPMNNFQKKILALNTLERLEKKFTGAANKAPYLYRIKK
ncbi:NUDIX hydrolase [Algoriphagus sp. PAP.12]|uniref:NUDIX hydrolase n=1 Tax=Algoriphagus sp. PAP.12 TaxID=2996678 RepID=UPI00227D0903|nr:NUDIX domain-containing protein [Algoriphagus sp. PAP.12]